MRRALVPSVVVAALWLGLEQPRDEPLRVAAIVALALAPALVRPRLVALAVSLLLGVRLAFGLWPRHPIHYAGLVAGRFANGFLDFYDVRTPFDPRLHPEMRGIVLAAVFGFVLALGLAVATRRPVAATVALLIGAGWPATLAGSSGALWKGAAILVAAFVVLGRTPRAAVPLAAAVALAAVAASSAVAQGGLVDWRSWNFNAVQQPSVSVSYVWNAQYDGLTFPRVRTTVLEIKAPRSAPYWRAAVLDVFAGDRWLQGAPLGADALEPPAARDPRNLLRADVTVAGLADVRLVGASVPVAFSAGSAPLQRVPGGALLPAGLSRGFRYTAWSYAPQPRAAALDRSPPDYPGALRPFLSIWPGVRVPPFGSAQRLRRVNAVLDAHPAIARYATLEHVAYDVAGAARTPYAAASALERWFTHSGGFRYAANPPVYPDAPLVGFVAEARAGYCQYFAGAMALMLRYLGVPARVAVGFSSGTYDPARGVWTVTDHDAHAWVEAWFRGYGWLPFDPTPAAGRPERGLLAAPYSSSAVPAVAHGRARGVAAAPGAQGSHRHGETGSPTSPRAPSSGGGGGDGSLFALLGLVLAAALAGLVGAKAGTRRARYLSRNPRRVAAACRRELADFLLDQRIEAARSATLYELGALVREELAVDPDRFVAAATAARFGPPAGAARAARDARRELRLLMRALRTRLTALERARGLLSLRSLGFAP